MEARWKIFNVVSILQLIISGLLTANIIFQVLSRSARANINWMVYLWIGMIFILVLHSLFNIHILHRYYPDQTVPVVLTRTRILLTILSWITVITLSVAISDIVSEKNSWKNLGLIAWLIIAAVFILTLVSLASLILQNGLLKKIRKNQELKLNETIDMIGQNTDNFHPIQ